MNVITLCGSSKFIKQFDEINRQLTIDGNVVFSLGVFGHAEGYEPTEEQRDILEQIHRKKIDLSDEIYVVDVGGYIGKSTKEEIEYAIKHDKKIRWYSKEIKDVKYE